MGQPTAHTRQEKGQKEGQAGSEQNTCQFTRELGGWVRLGSGIHQYCVLAGAGEIPHLTLHWLAHTQVKSEVTPGKVSWETPLLDHWTETLTTGKMKGQVSP